MEDVSPEELSPPLGTVIDAEALDRLVNSMGPSTATAGEITFEYRGYTIQLRKESEIGISVHDTSVSSDVSDTTPQKETEQPD